MANHSKCACTATIVTLPHSHRHHEKSDNNGRMSQGARPPQELPRILHSMSCSLVTAIKQSALRVGASVVLLNLFRGFCSSDCEKKRERERESLRENDREAGRESQRGTKNLQRSSPAVGLFQMPEPCVVGSTQSLHDNIVHAAVS